MKTDRERREIGKDIYENGQADRSLKREEKQKEIDRKIGRQTEAEIERPWNTN